MNHDNKDKVASIENTANLVLREWVIVAAQAYSARFTIIPILAIINPILKALSVLWYFGTGLINKLNCCGSSFTLRMML